MSSDATTPVILSACRTPIGKYLGAISSLPATRLGAIAIKEAVRRAGIDPQLIDDVIMGHVVQGGAGQAPARQAMIHAGLPAAIPALTINKVCGSGLKAVMLAAQSIKAGDAQCVVAGGMESMSNAPHYLYNYRNGIKAGNQTVVDGMIHDGLWDSFGNNHMGEYAEYTAEKAKVSRQDQDAYAVESHRKAVAAQAAGRFKGEMIGVDITSRSGTTTVSADESPRADTTADTLAKLKPVFRKDGTVTAGNAPGLNDGGAATVVASLAFAKAHGLTPMARITAYAAGGGEPK
ncbi:MAG TPA: thiolase family protein, partial [Steroidobacteraceae bacterium]